VDDLALGPELLVKAACLFLVGAMLLPFELWSGGMLVLATPGPTWAWDIQFTHQTYNKQVFRWSFMGVTVTAPAGSANPALDPQFVGTRWLFLFDYWGTRGPLPFQSILQLVFVLQIAAILLGLAAWKKLTSAWLLIPLFLVASTVSALYFAESYSRICELSFGFWLSLVACVFIFIPLARFGRLI
jgi:hypothetical protein